MKACTLAICCADDSCEMSSLVFSLKIDIWQEVFCLTKQIQGFGPLSHLSHSFLISLSLGADVTELILTGLPSNKQNPRLLIVSCEMSPKDMMCMKWSRT